MRTSIPDFTNKNFISRSKSRRLTFAYNNWSSGFRLIINAMFDSPTRYTRYLDLSIARADSHNQRLKNMFILDENSSDKTLYISTLRAVEQEIENYNPTFH